MTTLLISLLLAFASPDTSTDQPPVDQASIIIEDTIGG